MEAKMNIMEQVTKEMGELVASERDKAAKAALHWVLGVIEASKWYRSINGYTGDFICDADTLKTKIEAMIDHDSGPSEGASAEEMPALKED